MSRASRRRALCAIVLVGALLAGAFLWSFPRVPDSAADDAALPGFPACHECDERAACCARHAACVRCCLEKEEAGGDDEEQETCAWRCRTWAGSVMPLGITNRYHNETHHHCYAGPRSNPLPIDAHPSPRTGPFPQLRVKVIRLSPPAAVARRDDSGALPRRSPPGVPPQEGEAVRNGSLPRQVVAYGPKSRRDANARANSTAAARA